MVKKLITEEFGTRVLDMTQLKGSRDKRRNRKLRSILRSIIIMCKSGNRKIEIADIAQKALNDD